MGAHGYDHADLRQATAQELERQIGEAQRLLSEDLAVPIDAFCYAYGSYDERVLQALARYGYTTGFTLNPTRFQDPDEPYRLGRLRISYDTTLDDLARLMGAPPAP